MFPKNSSDYNGILAQKSTPFSDCKSVHAGLLSVVLIIVAVSVAFNFALPSLRTIDFQS
jgi:hypothetical protein